MSPVIQVLLLSSFLFADGFLHEDAEADRLVHETMSASYHLRLDEARAGARQLQQRYPGHPVGFTLIAETYWWEAQADPGNETIEDAYYQAQEAARKKAEAALDAEVYPRTEILSFLASTEGSLDRFEVTQKQAWFSAVRAGLRAHRHARDAYKLDENLYDVYLGLGAFNFFSGSLPAVLKPFAFLIGASGDKELGLEQLRLAREQSRYARTEERIVSYTALLEDGQYRAAFEMLEGLRSDYPTNHVFFVWATDWFLRQGRVSGALDYYERIWREDRETLPVTAQFALVEKARLQTLMGRRSDALATIERIRELPVRDPLLVKKIVLVETQAKNQR